MQTYAALVRTYGVVELNAKAAVNVRHAFIVRPGNAKHYLAVGFYDALEYGVAAIFGVLVYNAFQTFEHFLCRLPEFGLPGIACVEFLHCFAYIRHIELSS